MFEHQKKRLICQKLTALSHLSADSNKGFHSMSGKCALENGFYVMQYTPHDPSLNEARVNAEISHNINAVINPLIEAGIPITAILDGNIVKLSFPPEQNAEEVLRILEEVIRKIDKPFNFEIKRIEAWFNNEKQFGPHAMRLVREEVQQIKDYLSKNIKMPSEVNIAVGVSYEDKGLYQNKRPGPPRFGPQFAIAFNMPTTLRAEDIRKQNLVHFKKIFGKEKIWYQELPVSPPILCFYIDLNPRDACECIKRHDPNAFSGPDGRDKGGAGRI